MIDNTRKELRKLYSKINSKDTKNPANLIDRALLLLGDDLMVAARKHDLCRVL